MTYILLLNYNNWRDTTSCLESLFSMKGADFRVIVCDNNSKDESLQKIRQWATGQLPAPLPLHPRLCRLIGRAPKPVHFQDTCAGDVEKPHKHRDTPLVLIDNGDNRGFAAGNNTGLRYALAQPDMQQVWLLNNDTVVEADCLERMLARLQEHPGPAVCGSMIHFFDQPEIIQAAGGNRFNHLLGVASTSLARYTHENELPENDGLERAAAYLSGCSMLLPRLFLESVGLMDERYFLYFEEIDWFTRAGSDWRLLLAEDAHLYHREGGSIGSAGWGRPASTLSDFHMFRSKLLFMQKHYPRLWPLYQAHGWVQVLKRLLRGHMRNANAVGRALLGRPFHAT